MWCGTVALVKSSVEEKRDLNNCFNPSLLKNILTLPTKCRQNFDQKCLSSPLCCCYLQDNMLCNGQGKSPWVQLPEKLVRVWAEKSEHALLGVQNSLTRGTGLQILSHSLSLNQGCAFQKKNPKETFGSHEQRCKCDISHNIFYTCNSQLQKNMESKPDVQQWVIEL